MTIKHLVLIFLGLFSSLSNAQTVCLGTDATVCSGSTVTIEDCNPGGGGGGANVLSLTNASASYSLTDDIYSGVVNIGFSFEFYGNTYNQCVIGSNGIVSFDLSNAGNFCPWALGSVANLPNTTFANARNSMMPAYQDMNPSPGVSPNGEIRSETIGTAPNRQFIILFKDIISFSANAGECSYMGIIMNEGSNSFEFHIGNKPLTTTWNGGLAIQGSENQSGTVAHITTGRNVSQWTAFQEAKIWTPTAPNNTGNYTISPTPYLTITSPNSTYAWGNTVNTTTQPYNNGILIVNPALSGITGYFLTVQATGCGPVGGSSDTTFITGASSSVTASSTDDICSAGLGSVTATPISGLAPYTYNWPTLGGATTQTVNNVSAGSYQVIMTDAIGCQSGTNVVVGDTPASFQGDSTLVSCAGGSDGTAFAEMVPVLGSLTYLWDDPAAQTSQTAINLTAGTYTCTITSDIGCQGIVTVIVNEIPEIQANIANQTDVTCNSGSDGIIELNVIDGTAPYTYFWDHSTTATNIANDLMVGNHTITITDDLGCVITVNGTLGQPAALTITNVTPDTQICPEDDIALNVTGSGGSSAYTFTWSENGTGIGTGTDILVDPINTNTYYTIILSEQCGSPEAYDTVLIYFPTPILPSALPDMVEKCVPDTFYFTNTSTNPTEIATTFWEFGDNITHNEIANGADPVQHYYDATGFHTITLTTTSIFGCVYIDTMKNLIEVLPSPIAAYNFSKNPATIFETAIKMQDNSSYDVVSWSWDSPYSVPATSTEINPNFLFPDGQVGLYPITLAVETARGCVDTVTHQLSVIQDILFYAPNAFTPDGNEHNQTWKPIISGIDIYDYEIYIFNRWGQVIWESHDPNVGWDGTFKGKILPNDTYIWKAIVKTPHTDDRKVFNGSVAILKGRL